MGYDGIFVTNHFIDKNFQLGAEYSYAEKLDYYCADYKKAAEIGKEIGLKVFFGFEITNQGTDFLVYGLDQNWLLAHPEILEQPMRQNLRLFIDEGALVIHAHPFREAGYIDHIRLYPREIHGVEVINACRKDEENKMAELYADFYGFRRFAGSDNHIADKLQKLAGIQTEEPLNAAEELRDFFLNDKTEVFYTER